MLVVYHQDMLPVMVKLIFHVNIHLVASSKVGNGKEGSTPDIVMNGPK